MALSQERKKSWGSLFTVPKRSEDRQGECVALNLGLSPAHLSGLMKQVAR